MDPQEAARLLGVAPDADDATLRGAYRRLLLVTHPDVSSASDATDRTVMLTRALEVLTDAARGAPGAEGDVAADTTAANGHGAAARGDERDDRSTVDPDRAVAVALVDDDTIGIAAPHGEALLLVLETAHQLGDVAYLDHSAGMVELIVEFVDAPTSSVLMSLQGRATGVTEVFCTVEPLSGGDAPSAAAVTRLLLSTMVALHPSTPT